MRKKSREMDSEWALEVMHKAPYITVSFIDEDGKPYGLPLSLASDDDVNWYFHGALEGKKLEAIKAHPEVCLSAVTRCAPTVGPKDGSFTLQFKSAIAFGKAEIVTEDAEKIHGLRLICERFLPQHMDAFDQSIARSLSRTAVVRITLTEPPTGKRKQYDKEGVEMPQLGYGVYQVEPDECERCVVDALSVGYRMIDTAQAYLNEEAVGNAWKKSGVNRDEIFLVSKVWPSNYGDGQTMKSIDESLRKLQTDYIDLMLLHQPYCDRYGAYRDLEKAYKAGKIRAIGVSNFFPDHLIDLASNMEIAPMVNQMETHVFNQQHETRKFMNEFGTKLMAWAPLAEGQNGLFTNPTLTQIGEKYGKTAAQVALRWLLQSDVIIIPKTVHKERMQENQNLFDFELDAEDMQKIAALDTAHSLFLDHHSGETTKQFMEWRAVVKPTE